MSRWIVTAHQTSDYGYQLPDAGESGQRTIEVHVSDFGERIHGTQAALEVAVNAAGRDQLGIPSWSKNISWTATRCNDE